MRVHENSDVCETYDYRELRLDARRRLKLQEERGCPPPYLSLASCPWLFVMDCGKGLLCIVMVVQRRVERGEEVGLP